MVAVVLAGLAVAGLVLAIVQAVALRQFLPAQQQPPAPHALPFISILKPLCGFDDALWSNLRSFSKIRYPRYEILLGVKDVRDPAFPVALRAAQRWPGRVRVVVQRGAPGLNPKVNQLITLASAARGDVLVVSDSNIRVGVHYLRGIAAAFDDPRVGLVTHPLAGVGERTAGALFDNLVVCGSIAPGVVSAKLVAGRDLVIGKSMALRKSDLRALGGFERLKDMLAEDFLCGRMVVRELGKRVAIVPEPIFNVSRSQSIPSFFSRYFRWSVMQRMAVGNGTYAAQIILNPVALAFGAFLARPERWTALALVISALARAALVECSARALGRRAFSAFALCAPLADLILAAAWAAGLVRNRINWRGNFFRVSEGTRLARLPQPELGAPEPQPDLG